MSTNNVVYESIVGSSAYGVSEDDSDLDLYAICIPPKDSIFPHLRGEIKGFGTQYNSFETYQEHHIEDGSREFDITIFSIVKYFELLRKCTPNCIDLLFVPENCITHTTRVGELIRESRKLFLHKGCWPRYKGYAYSQAKKLQTKNLVGKRAEKAKQIGYDVKCAYHIVRLLNEIEQILLDHDLDLQKNKAQLKSIRRGEWSLDQVRSYMQQKESELESLHLKSRIPDRGDEQAMKEVLLSCLEIHYGNLSDALVLPSRGLKCLEEIRATLTRFGF